MLDLYKLEMHLVYFVVFVLYNQLNEIDEHFGRKDFAHAVSIVLKESYGSHNFEGFMTELQEYLGFSKD